jgi:hypothetical protein
MYKNLDESEREDVVEAFKFTFKDRGWSDDI